VIVPHGWLHYVPFTALFSGQSYWIEEHELSFLPGASLLRYCRESPAGKGENKVTSVAHSWGGRLPKTLGEASQVAAALDSGPNSQVLLEEAATLDSVRRAGENCRVLHLATHGDFRPDNPLFSGLLLADGWLTTLDVFNMKLNASLVTLSACQTGRNVVAGGDELLGLMRSFLAAGAASLVTTHWVVDDDSTARLMKGFYTRLTGGVRKGEALRQAQIDLIRGDDRAYRHPFYWAPFYLVGDAGQLSL
jgi:CHAT domain-containing protein